MPRLASVKDKSAKPQIGLYSSGQTAIKTAGQFEFDLLSFRDPAGQKQFSNLNGTHPEVREWMKLDRRIPFIIEDCLLLADDLIKPKQNDAAVARGVSTWLSFGFRDQHGKWAAPAVAELVADALDKAGYLIVVWHAQLPQDKIWTPTSLIH